MEKKIITEEEKENQKLRKEKIGCYFLDLSKLTFGAVVLGGIVTVFTHHSRIEVFSILMGCIMTTIFGIIGNKFLKLK
jgi:hypothetical protein